MSTSFNRNTRGSEKENQDISHLPIPQSKRSLPIKPRIPLLDLNRCSTSKNEKLVEKSSDPKQRSTEFHLAKDSRQHKTVVSGISRFTHKSGSALKKPESYKSSNVKLRMDQPSSMSSISESEINGGSDKKVDDSSEIVEASPNSKKVDDSSEILEASPNSVINGGRVELLHNSLNNLSINGGSDLENITETTDEKNAEGEGRIQLDDNVSVDLAKGITSVETVVTPIKFVPARKQTRKLSTETMVTPVSTTNSCNGTTPVSWVDQETSTYIPQMTDSAVATSPYLSRVIDLDNFDPSTCDWSKILKHVESLSISNELLRSELDRHKRDAVRKDDLIKLLQEENTNSNRKFLNLQQQTDVLVEKAKSSMQSDIESNQQQITFLQNELSISQDDLQSQKTSYETKIEKLEKDLSNLEEDLCRVYRNHKDELAEINEEYARNDYRPHFEKAQQKVAELQEELTLYNNLSSALEKASILQDKLEHDFDERHQRIKEQTELLQLQQSHYETQFKEFNKQKAENEQYVTQAKEECDLLRTAHQKMSEELQHFKSQAQQYNLNQVQMVESNEFLDAENRMLQESLQEVERGCNNTQLELARCSAIITNKTIECTNLENIVKDLSDKLKRTTNELETTKVDVTFLYQYVHELLEKASAKAEALNIDVLIPETENVPPKSTGKSFVAAVLTAQTESQCSDNDVWQSPRDPKTADTSMETMHTARDDVDPDGTLNISGVESLEDNTNSFVEEEFVDDAAGIFDRIQTTAAIDSKRESAFMGVQNRTSILNPVQGLVPHHRNEEIVDDVANSDNEVEQVHAMIKKLARIVQQCDKARVEDFYYLQSERDQTVQEFEAYKMEQTYIVAELNEKLTTFEQSAIDAGVRFLEKEAAWKKSQELLAASESKVKELQEKLESILEQDHTIKKLRQSLETFVEENKQLSAEKEFAESALNELVASTKDGNPESSIAELIQLKRELRRSRERYFEQDDLHKETVKKAHRRMKTLEENWQKAEAEVTRLDAYISEIKQTLTKYKSTIDSCDELHKLLKNM